MQVLRYGNKAFPAASTQYTGMTRKRTLGTRVSLHNIVDTVRQSARGKKYSTRCCAHLLEHTMTMDIPRLQNITCSGLVDAFYMLFGTNHSCLGCSMYHQEYDTSTCCVMMIFTMNLLHPLSPPPPTWILLLLLEPFFILNSPLS